MHAGRLCKNQEIVGGQGRTLLTENREPRHDDVIKPVEAESRVSELVAKFVSGAGTRGVAWRAPAAESLVGRDGDVMHGPLLLVSFEIEIGRAIHNPPPENLYGHSCRQK